MNGRSKDIVTLKGNLESMRDLFDYYTNVECSYESEFSNELWQHILKSNEIVKNPKIYALPTRGDYL